MFIVLKKAYFIRKRDLRIFEKCGTETAWNHDFRTPLRNNPTKTNKLGGLSVTR